MKFIKLDRHRRKEIKARQPVPYKGMKPVIHKYKRLAKKGHFKADKRPCMVVTPRLNKDWKEVSS